MEPCSCAHAQQVRHLKSRVSQLEILLDKAQKRLVTTVSSSTYSIPSSISSNVKTPSIDVKKTTEYRALQAELDSERKTKMDLMANLKELTIASEATKAGLEHDLSNVASQRDALSLDLDEAQDEMEVFREIVKNFTCAVPMTYKNEVEKLDRALESLTESSSTKISDNANQSIASVLRDLANQTDLAQSRYARNMWLMFSYWLPKHVVGDMEFTNDLAVLERKVRCDAEATARGYLSSSLQHKIRSLYSDKHQQDKLVDTPLELDNVVNFVLTGMSESITRLEKADAVSRNILYQSVPSMLEEMFTLLSRSSSFAYPEVTPADTSLSKDVYETYLNQISASLHHTIRKYISSHQKSRQKISYRGFAAGDLALFLPTRNANSPAWAAFNVGAPHYFLAMDGIETDGKDFLIGRIHEVVEKSGEPGSESHLRGMPDVRKWWEVKISEKKKVNVH